MTLLSDLDEFHKQYCQCHLTCSQCEFRLEDPDGACAMTVTLRAMKNIVKTHNILKEAGLNKEEIVERLIGGLAE